LKNDVTLMSVQLDPENDDALFGPEFLPLGRKQAQELFGVKKLLPSIQSPWTIVKFQLCLTALMTVILFVVGLGLEDAVNFAVSGFFGGLLCAVPTIAFTLRLRLHQKLALKEPKQFVRQLVSAEVIKIVLTVIFIVVVFRYFSELNWIIFLAIYLITLQSYWLAGLILKR